MTNFGHITQRQEVIQYSWANCGSILAETETPIDYNIILHCSFKEVCPSCGDSLHQKNNYQGRGGTSSTCLATTRTRTRTTPPHIIIGKAGDRL
jgi:hypothetical protein